MKNPYILVARPCRFCTQLKADDASIPAALAETVCVAPDLSTFPLPLPSKKSDYTCQAETADGVLWYGAKTGLTRYDSSAEKTDRVMFFSAPRDLPDNNVCALYADGNVLWVKTETGVTKIEMKMLGAEEKALMLLDETLKYVDRRGMISQKYLAVPGDLTSVLPYGHSDNDGCFTAGFAIGEIFRYATYKREKGIDAPETQAAKKVATRAVEACLLLMHIHGRGDGFVSRSYLCADEPVPDDGFFFRKENGKAVCVDTRASREHGVVGVEIDASAPIPERLAKLYLDAGYTDDGIVYKADTSSDEITLHYLQMYFAHIFLACDDKELDDLIIESVKCLTAHIIDHGYELHDFTGKATTWAKWSEPYFESAFGWCDACLNSAEVLMYHKVVMAITGETGKWLESYNHLIERGYAELPQKHFDRLYQAGIAGDFDIREDIMYGDHMLAVSSLWILCTLETDPVLREKYREGFRSWRTSLACEHNPGYDLPFKLACPDDEIDMDRLANWFYRTNVSRLASGVSLVGRHDVPVRKYRGGFKEISWLPAPDELFISKYDRDPYDYKNEDSGGNRCVESCYVYTFAYWIGRYYGFFC